MPACGKKTATASDQGINTGQIRLQMAQRLLNCLANLGDTRSILFATARNCCLAFCDALEAYRQRTL
jgi:hypothetical protein